MEKVIAALWAPAGEGRAEFAARLLNGLPAALAAAGAGAIRLNLRDAAVEPGAGLIQQWQAPQQDAVVQFWLPSANACFREGVDAALADFSARFAAWLVSESTIIANTTHAAPPNPLQPAPGTAPRRTGGWSQASFISFHADRPREALLHHWHGHHTDVAIRTQDNFEYVQNLIVRALTPDAPTYDAFVEECFPLAALDQPHAFFDAVGDDEKFERNLADMMESCQAFIDFTRIDIIPTSQFDFAA
jgi:hypothetical protein